METIGSQKIWSYFDRRRTCRIATNTEVRKAAGHEVGSYVDLARKIAELQFRNRDYVLLFRGQTNDYRNIKRNTSIKPSLFRPKGTTNPNQSTLINRFQRLQAAEDILLRRYQKPLLGIDRMQRHRILRWSILQHYEVCLTPLLDVTHSIRIAASFASLKKGDQLADKAYIYVLGVPNISGAVTASAEAGLQIVRLSSVCPPSAMRPHIQEGYLLGEYPEIAAYAQKANYYPYEIDFGLRLIAKFSFEPKRFWTDPNFPRVPHDALYPGDKKDVLNELMLKVTQELGGSSV